MFRGFKEDQMILKEIAVLTSGQLIMIIEISHHGFSFFTITDVDDGAHEEFFFIKLNGRKADICPELRTI